MAIYKPSNCEPFLERLDLTEEYTGSFVINTNNVAVNGYKLRILDGGNNIVFEGAKFQKINAAGVAYNGDRVTIPIIKNVPDSPSDLEFNVIYYFKGGYSYYNGNPFNPLTPIVNFKNGYAVQPYKWQVILAQGLYGKDDNGNFTYNKRITTLSSGEDGKPITFRIWLEGWDADCFDGLGGTIQSQLSFSSKRIY